MTAPRAARLASTATAPPPAPTLCDALELGASLGAPFLTFHGSGTAQRFDARAARELARRWTTALSERGVKRGQVVAILLSTSPDFVGALLGTMGLGAVPLPLPAPMTFGPLDRYLEQLARIVDHAGARVLCTSPRVRTALDGTPLGARLTSVLVPADLAQVREHAAGPASFEPCAPALLQYTSGTTGRPKGVLVSHRALVANTAAIAHGLALTSADVGVSWLPMYHDMGLVGALLTAITHPYELHVLSPEAFVMKPRRWLELLSEHRGTISTAPNFAYEHAARRATADGLDLSCWRAALDGAEPVHAATLARFADRFAAAGFRRDVLMPVYGLAEATLAVSFHPRRTTVDALDVDRGALDEHRRVVAGSGAMARTVVGVGAPVAETTVAIVDTDGKLLLEDQVGQIVVQGPGLMEGYFHDEQASGEALRDGWLRTGDLGFVHDERLYVSGRERELIIQAGKNVHPEDVEEVALGLDARIGSVAAFARANEATGTDDLVLVVEARGLGPVDKETLGGRLRGEILAAIGVRTDEVAFWPVGAIPRTSSGKVRRRECAHRYAPGAAT